ncbi:MAG: hypothetical protein KGL75_03845, partial [Acidobacteriota bacterium]|nr:hypothetical protein [Acidobacteriota bacterium]
MGCDEIATALPVSVNPFQVLTVADSNAGHEMKIGLEWWTIGIGVACGYTIYSYRSFAEKAGGRDGHLHAGAQNFLRSLRGVHLQANRAQRAGGEEGIGTNASEDRDGEQQDKSRAEGWLHSATQDEPDRSPGINCCEDAPAMNFEPLRRARSQEDASAIGEDDFTTYWALPLDKKTGGRSQFKAPRRSSDARNDEQIAMCGIAGALEYFRAWAYKK